MQNIKSQCVYNINIQITPTQAWFSAGRKCKSIPALSSSLRFLLTEANGNLKQANSFYLIERIKGIKFYYNIKNACEDKHFLQWHYHPFQERLSLVCQDFPFSLHAAKPFHLQEITRQPQSTILQPGNSQQSPHTYTHLTYTLTHTPHLHTHTHTSPTHSHTHLTYTLIHTSPTHTYTHTHTPHLHTHTQCGDSVNVVNII